jgi:tetratricopeptide (TPR) repeat protein
VQTRLSALCDTLVETGWLLALVVVPVFFNPYSARIFEPDKMAILRSIALVAILGWIVGHVERTQGSGSSVKGWFGSLMSTPLVLPVCLFILAYLLSTVFSVLPHVSFWGSYERMQGLFSTLSYVTIFFVIFALLRRNAQVDRLVDAAILVSIPITLYGVLQHFRLDPLPWAADVTQRISSTMGNPIFAGAYLIMVIPLSLARLIDSWTMLREGKAPRAVPVLLLVWYLFCAVTQTLGVLFTQSRGPWLGIVAGGYFFAFTGLAYLWRLREERTPFGFGDFARAILFSLASLFVGLVPAYLFFVLRKKGYRWLWFAFLLHSLAFACFLLVFNLPNTPLKALMKVPYVGRLGELGRAESGTGKVRLLVWEGTANMIAAKPLRTVVGYGPETMKFVWGPYFPPELLHYEARLKVADRSHNQVFDEMANTGLIGFLVYMVLMGTIFFWGLRWTGFIETKVEGLIFASLLAGGALAGLLVPRIMTGKFVLSAVGIPLGFLFGMFLYQVAASLYHSVAEGRGFSSRPVGGKVAGGGTWLIISALLSGIVAHFVEIQFGIATVSTNLYFWVFLAIMGVLGMDLVKGGEKPRETTTSPASQEGKAPVETRRKKGKAKKQKKEGASGKTGRNEPLISPVVASVVFAGLITAAIFFTFGFGFIMKPQWGEGLFSHIWRSFTVVRQPGVVKTSYGMVVVLLILAVGGGFHLLREGLLSGFSDSHKKWYPSGLFYLLLAGALFIFAVIPANLLCLATSDSAATFGRYLLFLGLFGSVIVCFLVPRGESAAITWRSGTVWFYPVGVLLIILAVVFGNIQPIRADIYYKMGKEAEAARRWDESLSFYRKALDIAPDQDYYYPEIGRAMYGKINSTGAVNEKIRLFDETTRMMTHALEINPHNTDHLVNLGILYSRWAELYPPGNERKEKLEKASHHYGEATKGSAHKTLIFANWAKAYMSQGDYGNALAMLERSIALDDRSPEAFIIMGDIYASQNKLNEASKALEKAVSLAPNNAEALSGLGNIYFKQGKEKEAIQVIRKALEINPRLLRARSLLGFIHLRAGRIQDAIEENLKALEGGPDNVATHRNLAMLYDRAGNLNKAVKHLEQVLQLSPEPERPQIQHVLEQMRARQGRNDPRK